MLDYYYYFLVLPHRPLGRVLRLAAGRGGSGDGGGEGAAGGTFGPSGTFGCSGAGRSGGPLGLLAFQLRRARGGLPLRRRLALVAAAPLGGGAVLQVGPQPRHEALEGLRHVGERGEEDLAAKLQGRAGPAAPGRGQEGAGDLEGDLADRRRGIRERGCREGLCALPEEPFSSSYISLSIIYIYIYTYT